MALPEWVRPPSEEDLAEHKLVIQQRGSYLGLDTCFHEGHSIWPGHHHEKPAPTARSIWLSAFRGDVESLKDELDRTPEWQELVRSSEHANGSTPLHVAAAKCAKCTDLLVESGCDLDARDALGATPLHYAAQANRPECLEMLVDAGADTDIKGGSARLTPKQFAIRCGSAECVELLPSPDPTLTINTLVTKNPDNICLNTYDAEYFNSLDSEELKYAFLACLASGIENPDSGMGCYAMQPDDYDRFKPFFSKALAKYHKVAEDAQHVNDWSLEGVEGLPEGGVLDIAALGLPELSMRVRVGRNLKAFPLPGAMTKADRCNMENFMLKAFEQLIEMPEYGGKYCSFTPGHPNFVDEEEYQALVDAHIAFKDMSADQYLLSAGIAQHWPHGRGVYISEDKGFIIWCGEEDHLRIMCMEKGTVLNTVFDRLKGALDVVNGIEGLEFAISPDYGVVTSCPTNLGTGMRASLHIQLPNLTVDGTDAKAKAIAKPLGLSVRGLGGEHTPIGADGTVDISPSARFCIKEAEIITALYKGIEQLKAAEDAAGAGGE
jgi:protein-arginine kinase